MEENNVNNTNNTKKGIDAKIILLLILVFGAGVLISYIVSMYHFAQEFNEIKDEPITEEVPTVKSAWDIKWADLDVGTKSGYADPSNKTLAIDSTGQAISGFVGTFRAPGDSITYAWKVKNVGDIDANVTGVILGSFTCEPAVTNGSTKNEAYDLCNKLSVSSKYDGVPLTTSTSGNLLHGTSKIVSMTITYAAGDAVELSGDVSVSLGRTSFTYEQQIS